MRELPCSKRKTKGSQERAILGAGLDRELPATRTCVRRTRFNVDGEIESGTEKDERLGRTSRLPRSCRRSQKRRGRPNDDGAVEFLAGVGEGNGEFAVD
jgi:hypothetical protein